MMTNHQTQLVLHKIQSMFLWFFNDFPQNFEYVKLWMPNLLLPCWLAPCHLEECPSRHARHVLWVPPEWHSGTHQGGAPNMCEHSGTVHQSPWLGSHNNLQKGRSDRCGVHLPKNTASIWLWYTCKHFSLFF